MIRAVSDEIAAPVTPSGGKPSRPKMRMGSKQMFRIVANAEILVGVIVSPAPWKTAPAWNMNNMNGRPAKAIRR